MPKEKAEDLMAHADLVLNVAGATQVRTKQNLKVRRLVYYGTTQSTMKLPSPIAMTLRAERLVNMTILSPTARILVITIVPYPHCRVSDAGPASQS
jgi:hypothetical protein